MITATISGTYRHRLRVKILWFWVVKPWQTDNFSYSYQVDPATPVFTFHLPALPISLIAQIKNNVKGPSDLVLNAAVEGFDIPLGSFGLSASGSLPFHAEPIKGCVFQGVASVTAT